jgi:hypothetical protein
VGATSLDITGVLLFIVNNRTVTRPIMLEPLDAETYSTPSLGCILSSLTTDQSPSQTPLDWLDVNMKDIMLAIDNYSGWQVVDRVKCKGLIQGSLIYVVTTILLSFPHHEALT